jgi:hypothetical protein
MVHFESKVFANQELYPYWSKVKDTVKKFYNSCQDNRVILLFENSRLISSNAQFFDIAKPLFSKDMNIAN